MAAESSPIRTIPIRYAIPGLLAIVVVVAVGLTAVFSYLTGVQLANGDAATVTTGAAEHIRDYVLKYVEDPQQINDANVAAWRSGNLNLRDFASLGRYFYQQSRTPGVVPQLYYATAQGEYVGIDMTAPDGSTTLQMRSAGDASTLLTYKLDANGQQIGLPTTEPYDPRTAAFFRAAAAATKPTWSPVVSVGSNNELSMVAASPVYNPQGQLQGVFGLSLPLTVLTEFLRTLDTSPNGRTFIVGRDGRLIATSAPGENVVVSVTGGVPVLRSATESGDRLVQGASRHFTETQGGFAQVAPPGPAGSTRSEVQAFAFELSGQPHVGRVTSVQDSRGLDWVIVAAVPVEDFMAPVNANVRTTVILVALALVVASGPAYLFARRILKPVNAVIHVATSVEQGSYELDSLDTVARRTDELGQLARVFRRMAGEVKTREEQLREQVAELRIEIDEVKSLREVQEIVDTDFFQTLQTRARAAREARQRHRAVSGQPGPAVVLKETRS